ncbi:MAG: hypothetical protein ACKO96_36090 [Flammeovirgaceae bacterium]
MVEFQPAICGTGFARWLDEYGQLTDIREFYYITTSRFSGNRVEYLSFGFWGAKPKTGTYSLNEVFFSEYSIFTQKSDGVLSGLASYRGFSGSLSVEAERGFTIGSDNLKMIEINYGLTISMKLNLGCCSN